MKDEPGFLVHMTTSGFAAKGHAANVLGTLSAGVLPSVAPLFASHSYPRYNAFDWKTWQELDVLRRDLTPRFVKKTP